MRPCWLFTTVDQRPTTIRMGMLGCADLHHPEPHLESVQALTQWYNDRLGLIIASTQSSIGGFIVVGVNLLNA